MDNKIAIELTERVSQEIVRRVDAELTNQRLTRIIDNKIGILLKVQPDLSWWSEGNYWKLNPIGTDLYVHMAHNIICNPKNWYIARNLILERMRTLREIVKNIEEKKETEKTNVGQRSMEVFGNSEMFNPPTKEELERMLEYAGRMVICGDRITSEIISKKSRIRDVLNKMKDVERLNCIGKKKMAMAVKERLKANLRRGMGKSLNVEKVDFDIAHECFESQLYNRDVDFFNRLYDFLLGLGLIEKGNKTNFKRLFGGENTRVRWKWLGGTYELHVLIKMLVEYEVIGKNRYFAIAAECFYFEGDVKRNVACCNKGSEAKKKSICGFFEKEFLKS